MYIVFIMGSSLPTSSATAGGGGGVRLASAPSTSMAPTLSRPSRSRQVRVSEGLDVGQACIVLHDTSKGESQAGGRRRGGRVVVASNVQG